MNPEEDSIPQEVLDKVYIELANDETVLLGEFGAICAAYEEPAYDDPFVGITMICRSQRKELTIRLSPEEAYKFFVQLAGELGKANV